MTREPTRQVNRFICQYIEEKGYAPSVREIGSACYMGASAVMRHLDLLEAWGWITREIGVARSIRLGERNPLLKPDRLMVDKR